MKTQLTIEQSNRLIELGIDHRKAETSISSCTGDCSYSIVRIFTLADLLDILPYEIRSNDVIYNLDLGTCLDWFASYSDANDHAISEFECEELIDALYELVVWCIENGYIKTETK